MANDIEVVVKSKDETKPGFDSAQQGADRATKGIGARFRSMGPLLAAGAAGAGLAAGAALAGAVSSAMDREQLNAKLAARLGATGLDAEQLGKSSGKVYAAGFGDSLEDVNLAIENVTKNIGDLGKGAAGGLEGLSKKALTVAQTFDQDLGGVTAAVGQLMRTGMAKNADEAFDIVTKGFQSSANKADDLLETVTEYGTQFRKVGISGQQMTGLLNQGLKAGARDADTVADAIKEFSIRAIDGSKNTAAGFKALGLSGKQMAEDIAGGGPKANKALDLTLDKLRAMKDPAARSAAAVQLFGTKAEDLGDALYALDPSEAVAALGQVEGATDAVGKAMQETSGAKIERFKRRMSAGFTATGGAVLGLAEKIGGKLAPVWDDVQEKAGPVVSDLSQKLLPALGTALNGVISYGKSYYSTIMSIVDKAMPLIQTALNNFRDAIDQAKNSGVPWAGLLKTLGTILGVVAGVIAGVVVVAITALSFQLKIATGLIKPLWEVFKILVGVFLRGAGQILHAMALAFGWIPGIGPKLKAADKEFQKFRDRVNDALAGIHDRHVSVNVISKVNGTRVSTGYFERVLNAKPGRATAFAHGGITGAQGGGPRSGLIMVGEHGRELLETAPGSTVHSNPDTERMLAQAAGAGGSAGVQSLVIEWVGGAAGDEFLAWLRKNIRIRGGVTAALGA